jgi:serine/threonine protein phosphatase 1
MARIKLSEAKTPKNMRLYAIGDVHGCIEHLLKIHNCIRSDLKKHPVEDYRIIHLGDYIDKGPSSRAVIDFLVQLKQLDPKCIFLMGNHEEKFLNFLERPEDIGLDFIKYGGRTTIKSYGISARRIRKTIRSLKNVFKLLKQYIPKSHIKFLQNLEFSVSFGDYMFCHAGVRAGIPLKQQSEHDLIWIKKEFLEHKELYSKVIIHGHTPFNKPQVKKNRINVDTGVATLGMLSCVVLEGKKHRFITAT